MPSRAAEPLRRAAAGAALFALVAGITLWWTEPVLLERGAAERMVSFLPLLSRLVAEDVALPPEAFHERVRALTRGSDLRVTVVTADGEVIADSERTFDQLRQLDNHANRPEVRRAFASGRGESRRQSRTTGLEYVYLARRVTDPTGEVYAVRLAQPLHLVPLDLTERLRLLLPRLAVAALLGAAIGLWRDRRLHAPLRRLAEDVDRRRSGEPGDQAEASRGEAPRGEGSRAVVRLGAGVERLDRELRAEIDRLDGEHRHLLRIVDAMSDGVLVTDDEQTVELVNPVFRKLFATRQGGVGQSVLELSRSPALAEYIDGLDDGAETRSARVESEAGLTLELRGRRLAAGRALVMVRDLSDQARLDATRRDLVANVSHELRTPLAAIRGYAENLEDGALEQPSVAMRFVRRILAQCRRLEALLEDLLALSRLERADEVPPADRRPIDLATLAKQALETVRGLAEERQVDLSLECAEAPQIEASPDALERLLLNLLQNAIKYNRPGGSVTVTIERSDDLVVLAVSDTGLGISARDLPRIFERFYRVDSGRSREEGGTGLGLAIVKHAAQLHGGRVEVESRLGEGSTFRVVLPLTGG